MLQLGPLMICFSYLTNKKGSNTKKVLLPFFVPLNYCFKQLEKS